jgi:hypothetical protein
MEGLQHLAIMIAGVCGLLIGGVLVDADHISYGGAMCSLKGFFNPSENCSTSRGVLHYKILVLSLVSFCFCLAFGFFIHMIADFLRAW